MNLPSNSVRISSENLPFILVVMFPSLPSLYVVKAPRAYPKNFKGSIYFKKKWKLNLNFSHMVGNFKVAAISFKFKIFVRIPLPFPSFLHWRFGILKLLLLLLRKEQQIIHIISLLDIGWYIFYL